MSTGAAIVGGSLVSGLLGSDASSDAADAQVAANNAAIAEQRRQFDTILGLTAPQRDVGNAALNVLAQAFIPGYTPGNYGTVAPTTVPTSGGTEVIRTGYGGIRIPEGAIGGADPFIPQTTNTAEQYPTIDAGSLSEIFRNLPGSQFMVDEAVNALGNSFAARGGALSGNALSAIADRTSNMASNTVFNGLGQLAGIGNIGTGTAANAAQNQGNNVAALLAGNGNARASGISGSAQSINNAVQGGLSNWLLLQQLGG